MLIYNKYKPLTYLNMDDVFEIELSIKINAFRVYNLFKHSRKLIRSLLLLYFFIFSFNPFSMILFRGTAKYHIKLESTILVIADTDCYENYFRFN